MFALLAIAFLSLASIFDGWTWVDVELWMYIVAAVTLVCFGIAYDVLCIVVDHLPRAPKGVLAVLFCIDAESEQLYQMAKFKLVDEFNLHATNEGVTIQALCVSKAQIAKYNLYDNISLLALLEKTNSVLFVNVRYTADDVGNAENFELRINCAVSHPKFSDKANEVVSQDLRMMKKSVSRQKFTKANAINVFNFTAQTLVCACQYILGFVYLLSGNNRNAFNLLVLAKKSINTGQMGSAETKSLEQLIDDRIFSSLCQIAQECMATFQNEKALDQLGKLSQVLTMANMIRPETYFYNMNMAYVHIALNHDAGAAKNCIENCKASKENKDWMYSDAFLSAYCGHAPTTILNKYSKALKVPYESLVELVDYIEFIIEAKPEKTALHLAAGLIYEEMGDAKLMRQHLSVFLADGKGINKKTRDLLMAKISTGHCDVKCDEDCAKCAG